MVAEMTCCQDCMGMGVYAVHADNCTDDLCSLGAGEWDCRWSVVDCERCDGTGGIVEQDDGR